MIETLTGITKPLDSAIVNDCNELLVALTPSQCTSVVYLARQTIKVLNPTR